MINFGVQKTIIKFVKTGAIFAIVLPTLLWSVSLLPQGMASNLIIFGIYGIMQGVLLILVLSSIIFMALDGKESISNIILAYSFIISTNILLYTVYAIVYCAFKKDTKEVI